MTQSGLRPICVGCKLTNPMAPIPADVLIVDDDEPTQTFLRAMTRRLGFAAQCVGDGETAKLHLDGNHPWRVILLDLYLPKCDGFDVIAFMRKNAPFLLAHTIVVTAAGERDMNLIRKQPLIHCVLRKPIDINELAAHMAECAGIPAPNLHAETT